MSTDDESIEEGSSGRRFFLQNRGAEIAAETAEVDVVAYDVAGNLHSAFTLMKSIVERGPLGEAGLSLTAFIALWSIWVNGEMEAKEVADEVGIARSSFSELAQRLEKRGLLSRRQNPKDGRVVLFSVTPLGRGLVQDTWPRMNLKMQHMTASLSGEERVTLVDHLRKMVDQLEVMWASVDQPPDTKAP